MTLTPARAYRAIAIFFGLLSGLCAIVGLRAKWASTVDFDIVGVFWLIRNVGPIAVWILALLFAGFAGYFLIRAWASS